MTTPFERYLTLIASVTAIIGFIITPVFLPEGYKIYGYITSSLIIEVLLLLLCFFWGRRSFKSKNTEIEGKIDGRKFTEHLIAFFECKKNENENQEIIRFGIALSTPLWLSQKYKTRKTIGEYVEGAAINTHNTNAHIKVLIDDLGWTNVELGLYEEAEKRIKHGIRLSETFSNGYYLAKGHRHLFGLYFRMGRIDMAEIHLNEAIKRTNELNSDKKKDELIAEIHYAKSTLEYAKNNFPESLKEIQIAYEKYSHLPNPEWTIKLKAREGEVLISLGKIYEAIEIFKDGLNESKKYHFNKQIVVNLIGLGKCSFEEKELSKAKSYFDDAYKLADDIGMVYEKGIIISQLEKLKQKISD